MIEQITDVKDKKLISRVILEALAEWFEVPEAREKYISDSAVQVFFAASEAGKYVGFLCLKETGKSTLELSVMGVLKEFHRKGIGRELFDAALRYARDNDYEFIQVKTVAMGYYDDYDNTNRFYQSIGFKELEVFPMIWGEENPCQIYVMAVR